MDNFIVDEIQRFKDVGNRPLSEKELEAIRKLIAQLERASKYKDILGTFSRARLNELPIPIILWGQGHKLI